MTKYQDPSDYWWDKTTNSMRGDFESMYADIADPWDCNANVDSLPNDLLLALLKRFGPVKRLLDVGCGAGALTDRLHRELTRPTEGDSEFIGCDISATAVRRAAADYGGPELRFRQGDCTNALAGEGPFDVIVMSEILWYVLAQIDQLLQQIAALLTNDGVCAVRQYFPDQQMFAKSDCDGINGFLEIIQRSPLVLVERTEFVQTQSCDRVLVALLAKT